jgi:sec-independent protein translocase protein TatA
LGSFSIWHWLIVILLVMVLFGRGKISDLMGDVAKGIKSFKKGLNEDDSENAKPKASISDKSEQPVNSMADDKAAKG